MGFLTDFYYPIQKEIISNLSDYDEEIPKLNNQNPRCDLIDEIKYSALKLIKDHEEIEIEKKRQIKSQILGEESKQLDEEKIEEEDVHED